MKRTMYYKEWRKHNADKSAAYTSNRRKDCPEAIKRERLKYRFNISLEQANVIFNLQLGKCAICDSPLLSGTGFALDHDHTCCNSRVSCGICVREYLCRTCNWRLSIIEDIKWSEKARQYIERHKRK